MSKILYATCDASGKVSVDGLEVPEAQVLSEGTKESEGLLFVQGPKARYLPSSAGDIKDLIGSLVGIVDQIATIASGLDAVTVSPGGQAAAIAQLQTLKTQLEQSGEALK